MQAATLPLQPLSWAHHPGEHLPRLQGRGASWLFLVLT